MDPRVTIGRVHEARPGAVVPSQPLPPGLVGPDLLRWSRSGQETQFFLVSFSTMLLGTDLYSLGSME